MSAQDESNGNFAPEVQQPTLESEDGEFEGSSSDCLANVLGERSVVANTSRCYSAMGFVGGRMEVHGAKFWLHSRLQ